MDSVIILFSYHHGNTRTVAEEIAEVLDSEVRSPQVVDPEQLSGYDLVGFGSGIYDYKHHRLLLKLADELPKVEGKKAFIFSTSGVRIDSRIFGHISRKFHDELREKLQSKGYEIVGEFNCKGLDTNSFLKYFGGINKGHPNEQDLREAKEFAERLKEN